MTSIKDALAQVLQASDGPVRYRVVWAEVAHIVGRTVTVEQFEDAVAQLLDAGVARRTRASPEAPLVWKQASRGRQSAAATAEIARDTEGVESESDLMSAVFAWLSEDFIAPMVAGGARPVFVRDTSRSAPTGSGYWSRPDFTIALVRQYRFASERTVELYGFELKKAGAANIASVHEALAHTRWMHESFLIWHVPDLAQHTATVEELRSHCGLHGIGFIVFSKPSDYGSYEILVSPVRRHPDQERVDQYVETRFELAQIDALERAVRGM